MKKSFSKFFIFFIPLLLFSHPKDGKVISGKVAFKKDGNNFNINQSSKKSIIDWKSFSVKEKEKLSFFMPSKSSACLNRVIGKDISKIYSR